MISRVFRTPGYPLSPFLPLPFYEKGIGREVNRSGRVATHRPSTLVVSPAPMDHPSPDRRIAHRGRNEDDVQSIERYSWGWPLAPVLTSPSAITVASRMSY